MTFVEGLLRDAKGHVELRGTRCKACGEHAFPPRDVCSTCGARDLEQAWLSGRGTVHALTQVCMPPAGFDAPYLFAVVDLDEGPRTVGILSDEAPGQTPVQAVRGPVRDGASGFVFSTAD